MVKVGDLECGGPNKDQSILLRSSSNGAIVPFKPILHPVVCRFTIPGYTALMKLIAPKRWHKSVDGNLQCKQHLRTMIGRITRFWNIPPLNALGVLTLIALIPRLVAAVLSQGYFAHDDHFLIIDAAGSWVNGFDYNDWLPWNQGADPTPTGHSFFYVGLHYLLFQWVEGDRGSLTEDADDRCAPVARAVELDRGACGLTIALRLGDAVNRWCAPASFWRSSVSCRSSLCATSWKWPASLS